MGLAKTIVDDEISPQTEAFVKNTAVRWGEVLALTLALPILGSFFFAHDIFFMHTAFPWGLLPTVYVAARYSFFYGLVSLILLTLGVVCASFFYEHYLVGLFEVLAGACVSVLLVGHLSYLRVRRLIKVERINKLLQSKLNVWRREYQIVKYSHDQLDTHIVTGEPSIRASLDRLRNAIFNIQSVEEDQGIKQFSAEILQAFESLGWINAASLHTVNDRKTVDVRPIGSIGGHYDFIDNDPLLHKVLDSGRLALRTNQTMGDKHFSAVVAIPLMDSQERLWAVMIVYDIVLSALREERLKYLACLAGFCADAVEQRLLCHGQSKSDWFAAEIRRAMINRKSYGLSSTIATFSQRPRKSEENISPILQDIVRGQDAIFVKSSGGGIFKTMVLMPLTNAQQFHAFRQRLDITLNERIGANLNQLNVFVEYHEILKNELGKDQLPSGLVASLGSVDL